MSSGVQPFTAALPCSWFSGAGNLAGLPQGGTYLTCALLHLSQMESGSGEQEARFLALPLSPHLSVILSNVSNAKSIILRILKNVRARRDSRRNLHHRLLSQSRRRRPREVPSSALCPRSHGLFGTGWTWGLGFLTLSQVLSMISHGLLFISFKVDMMVVYTEAL